jgi:hypothetical protein
MPRHARAPVDRDALIEWLDGSQLLDTIDAILGRFDAGQDPLPDDEAQVSALLRARALLAATATEPDPLGARLAELDARWAERGAVAWVLEDSVWSECFVDLPLPSPETWWGARLEPGAPSEEAVLAALRSLGRCREG